MQSKKCSKCGEVKPLHAFHKAKNRHNGVRSDCKACIKLYCHANREKRKQYYKNYKASNLEKIKLKNKKYYKANCEKIKQDSKDWKASNCEKVKICNKEWNVSNREKLNQSFKLCVHNLGDRYIKSLLVRNTSLKSKKDIPQELIELTREQLKLHRAIKNY